MFHRCAGQATAALSPFKRVIGVDPSAKMVESAIRHIQSLGPETGQFEFVQSPAEKLLFLEDDSVDLVVSGEPCVGLCERNTETELNSASGPLV